MLGCPCPPWSPPPLGPTEADDAPWGHSPSTRARTPLHVLSTRVSRAQGWRFGDTRTAQPFLQPNALPNPRDSEGAPPASCWQLLAPAGPEPDAPWLQGEGGAGPAPPLPGAAADLSLVPPLGPGAKGVSQPSPHGDGRLILTRGCSKAGPHAPSPRACLWSWRVPQSSAPWSLEGAVGEGVGVSEASGGALTPAALERGGSKPASPRQGRGGTEPRSRQERPHISALATAPDRGTPSHCPRQAPETRPPRSQPTPLNAGVC